MESMGRGVCNVVLIIIQVLISFATAAIQCQSNSPVSKWFYTIIESAERLKDLHTYVLLLGIVSSEW